MKPEIPLENLVTDLAADAAPESFRESSLNHLLAQARQRRQGRQRVRYLLCAVIPLGLLAVGLALFRPAESTALTTLTPIVAEVKAVPATVPEPNYIPGTRLEELSDEALLALFPDRPLAMIDRGGRRELVFLDEPDVQDLH